jgi:hypothetical protein
MDLGFLTPLELLSPDERKQLILLAQNNDLLEVINKNIEELRKFELQISKELHKKRIEELEALTKQQQYLINLFKAQI